MGKKYGKIYKITNTKNNQIYIGCTINSLEKRFYEHLYRCLQIGYKSKLYNSMKKYGIDNFKIELIEECDLENIYEVEKKYINEYNSFNNGLNSTLGGEGCIGYKHSIEKRKKISEGVKNGKSHKNKTYEVLYGDDAVIEKEKRRESVKKSWGNMTDKEKEERVLNMCLSKQKNSKYGIELVKEIKEKINKGLKIKEFKEIYPQVRVGFFYELKNNKSWTNI